MELIKKPFNHIDLDDPFFDSLKESYIEFPEWFHKKSLSGDLAYVFEEDNRSIVGFLYLKQEIGPVDDVTPPLPYAKRIKIGTMKINPHGTKMGERFIKKILDHAIHENADEVYVTVFEHHDGLLTILKRYGFHKVAKKLTDNGTELVLLKNIYNNYIDQYQSYPIVKLSNAKSYILSIQPQYHTRLLPDSILRNENSDIVEDISSANSIHKVYLSGMKGLDSLRQGDILVIYRTSDNLGPAHYRAVATSIGVVEDYRHISSFANRDDFFAYCNPHSVFSAAELNGFWNSKKYPYVFKFMYNIAFKRRVTRGVMIEELGLPGQQQYWGFFEISHAQVRAIANKGMTNESLIID